VISKVVLWLFVIVGVLLAVVIAMSLIRCVQQDNYIRSWK